MNANELKKLLLWYFIFFIGGTAVFIFLFHTSLFDKTVFFYRGITFLFIATIVVIMSTLSLKKHSISSFFTVRDIFLITVIFFSIHLLFFTHVPVTADRSISVFLLGYMNHHPEESFTKEALSHAFIEKYVYKNEAIEKRFEEQIVSGNIVYENGTYKISKQGQEVMSFYKTVSDLFNIDKKNIFP